MIRRKLFAMAPWGVVVSVLTLALCAGSAAGTPRQQGAEATAVPPRSEGPEPTSCIACHGDAELFALPVVQLVTDFAEGVHASVGLSCHDCHGGNPDPALFEDYTRAKGEGPGFEPFRGAPDRVDQPALCGECHSSATFMRRYDPAARIDQEQEYRTSHHGQALARGDERVAVCTSCHGVHGIRRIDDPASRVYPTRVAITCGECHSDPERMAPYALAAGQPLPVDQYARWSQSVHAEALLEREDLSAPTCNDCHGNHGAAPPGLDSINFVCGQCHGREAEMFRGSVKKEFFRAHNEYLVDAEGEGCAACHEEPEPQARLEGVRSFGECAVCHGNHGVVRPNVALLSPLPEVPCVFCHEGGEIPLAELPDAPGVVSNYEQHRDELLQIAGELGLVEEARFDWLVDQALGLPEHTVAVTQQGRSGMVPRPEFDRLFTKFRIGKTTYQYRDPRTGQERSASIMRCENCHASREVAGEDAVGLPTATEILARMRQLTTTTARAERILLAARRGGVQTRDAAVEIDQAVDARIGLDVLVHGFRIEGAFDARYREGMEHAEAALVAGRQALATLTTRRRGLALVLAVVLIVLVALSLKIRDLSRCESENQI